MCSSWYNNWVTQQHARCNNENIERLFEAEVLGPSGGGGDLDLDEMT